MSCRNKKEADASGQMQRPNPEQKNPAKQAAGYMGADAKSKKRRFDNAETTEEEKQQVKKEKIGSGATPVDSVEDGNGSRLRKERTTRIELRKSTSQP